MYTYNYMHFARTYPVVILLFVYPSQYRCVASISNFQLQPEGYATPSCTSAKPVACLLEGAVDFPVSTVKCLCLSTILRMKLLGTIFRCFLFIAFHRRVRNYCHLFYTAQYIYICIISINVIIPYCSPDRLCMWFYNKCKMCRDR